VSPGFFHSRSFLSISPPGTPGIRCCSFYYSRCWPWSLHPLWSGEGRPPKYLGEVLSDLDIELRYPKGDVGVYCLALSSSLFIDAALSRGVGASANASRHGIKPNARFVVNPSTLSARLIATRSIKPGGEIFVAYGRDYWIGGRSSHSTVDIPEWEWDLSNPFSPAPAVVAVSVPPGSVALPVRGASRVSSLRSVISDDPPPPTFCEVHVGPPAPRCLECVPGFFVCPLHVVACGGVGHSCCSFCLKLLCWEHLDCPCELAVARRLFIENLAPPVSIVAPACAFSVPVADNSVVNLCLPDICDFVSPQQVPVSSCLSPGPRYDGPVDPEMMIWPLGLEPDWPISDSWRDFAFEPVVFPPISATVRESVSDISVNDF
jgi:hypothetical protein